MSGGGARMFGDYESIEVGAVATLKRRISADDVKRFVELTGDDNPLHVDKAYASRTSFHDTVVHGMLGASFISTIIGTRLPGEGSLWVSQSMDFLLPVRLNDELTITCKVLKKYDRERLVDIETTITNQFGQRVLSGSGKVKLLKTRLEETFPEGPVDRVALVTGGSGEIGSAICEALAEHGHSVVVNYRSDAEAGERVAAKIIEAGGKAIAIRADVLRQEELNAMVERAGEEFGPVSVLVNNASGRIGARPFMDTEWADVEEHIHVQARAAFLLSKLCVSGMQAMRFGRIINIVSEVIDNPPPAWMSYAMGKGALATLTRCMAVELGHHGIRVNCVAPGMTETRLVGDIPERSRMILARQNPVRRLGRPADVAAAVAWLALPETDFVNGETLRVNGGTSLR